LLQARPNASKLNDSGRANGLPMKISVFDLNDASSVHTSGAITTIAHTARAMCASELKKPTSDRFDFFAPASARRSTRVAACRGSTPVAITAPRFARCGDATDPLAPLAHRLS
jgi:hypothetical protein